MIVLDANVLLYAYSSGSAEHAVARQWLAKAFSGDEVIGLPWQTVHAFLRIVTNPRISPESTSMVKALAIVQQWVNLPNVQMMAPGERHWSLLKEMLTLGQVRGPITTDAQLAAITLEYGGILYTTDRDFARFPGLRWLNPLEPGFRES